MNSLVGTLFPVCRSSQDSVNSENTHRSSALNQAIAALSIAIIVGIGISTASYFLGQTSISFMAITGGTGLALTVVTSYVTLRYFTYKAPGQTPSQIFGQTPQTDEVSNEASELIKLIHDLDPEAVIKLNPNRKIPIGDEDSEEWTTILHKAAEVGDENLISVLIAFGADINQAEGTAHKYTPFDYAYEIRHINIMKLLLKNGVDCSKHMQQFIQQYNHYFLSFLLENGADPNMRIKDDQYNKSILHFAAERKNSKAIKIIIKNGANPDLTENQGSTPLHYVVYHTVGDSGGNDALRTLLDLGADSSIRNQIGFTPLELATKNQRDSLINVFNEYQQAES